VTVNEGTISEVSFDLAVWEGTRPATNPEALAAYQTLYDKWFGGVVDDDRDDSVTPGIVGYLEALLQRWPDITTDEGDSSPWADGPLINNAAGNFLYFAMVWSKADEAAAFCAEVARAHGLVCFDPQAAALLT
jgi:hypothetical protein